MRLPVGTVVYLKVGGPAMVTNDLRLDEVVSCEWFDRDGHLQRDAFDLACLVIGDGPKPQ